MWPGDCIVQSIRRSMQIALVGKTGTRRRLALCRLIAAFLVLAAPAATRGAEPSSALNLHRLDGRSFSLDSLKGKVVVLDFWASWCVPCRTSFPFFDSLQRKYAAQGLSVVGLTLEDDGDGIAAFLDDVPVDFLIIRDPSGKAGEAFDVVAMPTTFLLDREGRVAARFEGGDKQTHAKVESAVKTLLAGGSLPTGTGVRVSTELEATGSIKAWQRGYLADPIMRLDGDGVTQIFKEHIHASKEAAAGDGGPSGGGCGCN
jgi:cytochrome c biogenesis protein CcmG/thiol:disulfide interchange protein DsbE